MKIRFAIAVAALQVILLAYMAGQREWIARFGTPLTLRTAPVDPNDPMLGAYVRFNYDISDVPIGLCRQGPAGWIRSSKGDYRQRWGMRDRIVYAALRIDDEGFAEVVSLDDARPDGGLFIRGRVESIDDTHIQVRFGVEAFFMQKDAARRAEHEAWNEKAGAPTDVHVAVGSSGIAVLKGFEWEPLGITLEFPPAPRREATGPRPAEQPGLTAVTVVLHNYGDTDLAIVDLPGGQSFRLLQNARWTQAHYKWIGEGKNPEVPPPAGIVILKPGSVHKTFLDLTDSRWWVVDTRSPGGNPLPMRDIKDPWSTSFRIEYLPPPRDTLTGLPSAGLVRHASLRSRAFNANRRVD